MRSRGQGTFEYVLLLGGVLLIVVLALVVLQSSFFQASTGVSDIELKKCKLSAQQTPACFTGATFDGSKSFNMLGYQANPLRCDCTDYNPNAFTVSVGQAPLKTLDFSSIGGYSSLHFDEEIPADTYVVSLTLPKGKYDFFLVKLDGSIRSIAPSTNVTLADGRILFSFMGLPAGSRIKVNPSGSVTPAEVEAAKGSKTESPAAEVLEKQAGTDFVDAVIDAESSFKIVKLKDGRLLGIYTFTPPQDHAGGLELAFPVAAQRVVKIHPASSGVTSDGLKPDVSVVSWDYVQLSKGTAFRVVVELTPDVDLQQAAAEVSSKIGKIKGKRKLKSGAGCPVIPLINVEVPLGCSSSSADSGKSAASPSPPVSLNPSVSPSVSARPDVSASPIPGPNACIAEKQGCTPSSNMPLSIERKCCSGLCQPAGEGLGALLTWQCPDKGKATPSPSPSPSPSPTPTTEPKCVAKDMSCTLSGNKCCGVLSCIPDKKSQTGGLACQKPGAIDVTPTPTPKPFDISKFKIVESKPWEFFDPEKPASPPSTPYPPSAELIKDEPPAPVDENEFCGSGIVENYDVACKTGLSCRPADPYHPGKPQCQDTAKAKIYTAAKTELSFAPDASTSAATLNSDIDFAGFVSDSRRSSLLFEDAPTLSSTQTPDQPSFEATALPVDDLAQSAGGKGFGIKGFIRGYDGYLYIAFQQPEVKTVSTAKDVGNFQYDVSQPIVTTSLAVSKDNGKTWTFIATQPSLPKSETFTPNAIISTPSAYPGTHQECASYSTKSYLYENRDKCYDKSNFCASGSTAAECTKKYNSCRSIKGGYECATWACICNPPTENREYNACDSYKTVTNPTPEPRTVCTNYKLGKSNTDFVIYGCIYVEGGTPGSKDCVTEPDTKQTFCSFCSRWPYPGTPRTQIYCASSYKIPYTPPPFSPSVTGFRPVLSLSRTEFEGLAPAPKSGAYLYYRVYSTELKPGTNRNTPQGFERTNSSELHALIVDKDGLRDYVFPNKATPLAEKSLRFIGSSGTRQFFSEDDKLYFSEDGGQHLTPQGFAGYNDIRWRLVKDLPDRCENKAFAPKVRETENYNVVLPIGRVYSVAGGKLVSFGNGIIPIHQQSDGYFPYAGYLLNYVGRMPDNVPKGMVPDFDRYLSDSYFNKDFYTRYLYYNSKSKRFDDLYRPSSSDAVVDSNGGLHLTFLSNGIKGDYSGSIKYLYHQYFPASVFDSSLAPKNGRVYLLSSTDCPACSQVKEWFSQNKIQFSESLKDAPESLRTETTLVLGKLKKEEFPLTVIEKQSKQDEGSPSYLMVKGNDSIRLSNELGIILDPVLVEKWSSASLSLPAGKKELISALKLYLTSDGIPVIWLKTGQGLNQIERYNYTSGLWGKKSYDVNLVRDDLSRMVSNLDWFNPPLKGLGNDWYKTLNLGEYQATGMSGTLTLGLPAGNNVVSSPDSASWLVFDKNTAEGVLWPDDPKVRNDPKRKASEYYRNYYSLYSLNEPTESLDPEPTAGAVLSELVPYQRLQMPIPVSSPGAPSITVSSEPAGLVTATVEKDDEDAYYADLTIDARSYLKGGKLDIGSDKVSGKVVAKVGKQKADMPFEVAVRHVAPENLAYAAADKLTFYAYKEKGASRPIFLVNNFNRPLTFACGSVFTKVLAGNSIASVDVAPPKSSTSCTLALDGVPTRQVIHVDVIPQSSANLYTREASLAPPASVFGRPVGFKDCANGYCNCQEVRAALTDFESLVASHVSRLGSQASPDWIQSQYEDGYMEMGIFRTGVFDDLDDQRLGTCSANFAGWAANLQPGRVYKFKLYVPQAKGVLFWQSRSPTDPQELVKPFSYSGEKGIEADQSKFLSVYEVG